MTTTDTARDQRVSDEELDSAAPYIGNDFVLRLIATLRAERKARRALPEPWVLSTGLMAQMYPQRWCLYCHWHEGNPEGHAPDCPWRALVALDAEAIDD